MDNEVKNAGTGKKEDIDVIPIKNIKEESPLDW